MVTSALVDTDLRDGERLIQELDAAGFPVTSALWLYEPELETWRLVIASPVYDERGPMATYVRIQEVIAAHDHQIRIEEVSARSPSDRVVRLLRSAIKTGTNVRFRGNTVDGVYIEDAYIYRMN